jgi:uroporphyrinogen decarboxylase
VPASFFREFELPRLAQVFRALTAEGAAANWLHIAGPVAAILPYYAKAGVQIANVDYCVNVAEAAKLLPTTCLDGNIKSLTFVEGNPAGIESEAQSLLRMLRQRGGFVLSSGCEIPPESRPENIAAMVDAVRASG